MVQIDTQKLFDDWMTEGNRLSKKRFRNGCGVYAIYHKRRCLYVGASGMVKWRAMRVFTKMSRNSENPYLYFIIMGLGTKHIEAKIKYLPDSVCGPELGEYEKAYCEYLKPILNLSSSYYYKK